MTRQFAGIMAAGITLAAGLSLAACGSARPAPSVPSKAPPSIGQSAPAATPTPSSIPVLHTGQTAILPPSVQQSGVSETWTLNSVHYISYAQSQLGRADSVDVAQQIGTNEPLPSDQLVVLGITAANTGTEPDTSPVISGQGSTGSVFWVTEAGKVGLTRSSAIGSSATGVLAPYASNAEPSFVNQLNAGQSITGYVVFEVPVTPSALVVATGSGSPVIMVDPLHLTKADTCKTTAKFC